MKRHNENLGDFRSDPVYGDKALENAKESDKAKNEPDQYNPSQNENRTTEVFVDISSESYDDSLDNTTIVFTNGKPSFVSTPVKKTVSEPKPPVPTPPAPQSAPAPTVTASEDIPKESANDAKAEATENISEGKSNDSVSSDVKEPLPPISDSTPEDAKEPAASVNEAVISTEDTAEAPLTADKEASDTAQFANSSFYASDPQINNATGAEITEPSQPIVEKATDTVAVPPVNLPENTTSEPTDTGTTQKKKVPATDDDFILAKPHSKKKRHHSHSHSRSHSHTHSHSSNEEGDGSALPTDNVDDYIYARYRKYSGKSHHHHRSSTSSDYIHTPGNEATPVVRSTTTNHFRNNKKKDRKWKRRPWWQKLLIILAWISGILLVLALAALIFFLISSHIGLREATNYNNASISPPTFKGVSVSVEDNGKTVFYKGQQYKLNTNIANIICMGIDTQDIKNTEYETLADKGQADALFLVALDTETGETTVISIPRDTMADVDIYDADGKYLRTEKLQICQSYAYGDGQESSCQNTISAVRRIFYQLPLQTYFAMDISAIAPINDSIGGVRLRMIDDSFYDINLIHRSKGEVLTLYGDNARKYVQQRDVNANASSINRLERQIQYLKAFSKKALSETKKDITTPISLYNVISSNSISNIDINRITGFARCLIENGITNLQFKTIPGESKKSDTLDENGEAYNEFYINEEAFYELFLDTFYVPVK